MPKRETRNYLGRNLKRKRRKDRISKERRSWLMSLIKSKGSNFERKFAGLLKTRVRKKFTVNDKGIRGTPDIVFKRQRICIFLDSNFWHGWQYSRWKKLLKNEFWRNKIEQNKKRDRKTSAYLRTNGWTVLRFWEHQIKNNPEKAIQSIEKITRKR